MQDFYNYHYSKALTEESCNYSHSSISLDIGNFECRKKSTKLIQIFRNQKNSIQILDAILILSLFTYFTPKKIISRL